MLRGRFGDTSGRPYVEGRLLFPRLALAANISFLVDTGADTSLLMPGDGTRMGLDYSLLAGDNEAVGVGGLTHNFTENALLAFLESRRTLYVYAIQLDVAPPTPDVPVDIPSLLGRDVLDRWAMSYNKARNRLAFRVLSADLVIPVPASP